MNNKQKVLWETLAQENPRYYINSDKGRGITEEEFRKSGEEAYQKLIASDNLLKGRDTILDFGCGTGRLTEFMAHDFKNVYGVDISNTMIEEARNRLAGLTNVYLKEIDGIHIPLPEKSIKTAFSYLVFQHIKTRDMVEEAFSEIYRVLFPQGVFKVLLRGDTAKDMEKWWSGVEYHQKSAVKMCTKIGFKPIKIQFVDKYAYWLWLIK